MCSLRNEEERCSLDFLDWPINLVWFVNFNFPTFGWSLHLKHRRSNSWLPLLCLGLLSNHVFNVRKIGEYYSFCWYNQFDHTVPGCGGLVSGVTRLVKVRHDLLY